MGTWRNNYSKIVKSFLKKAYISVMSLPRNTYKQGTKMRIIFDGATRKMKYVLMI